MRAWLALPLLLVAGCGDSYQVSNQGADENQIRRLATPEKAEVDPLAPARPAPLTPAELGAEGFGTAACAFSNGDRLLLAVNPGDAIAKVGGNLLHFAHSAPVGPTGGFFEDRQISVSVGRTGEIVPGEGDSGSWPARLTVTNRRAGAQIEVSGTWRCG